LTHPYEDRYRRVYEAGARFWEDPVPTEELASFIDEWKPPRGSVIEFGCGEGRDAIFLARLGYRVTGVDIAPSAIGRARDWAQEEGVEAEFVVGDVRDLLDLPADHYDLGVNVGCLHMFTDPEDRLRHLREAFRVLRSGALYFFLNKGGGEAGEAFDRFGPGWRPPEVGEMRPRKITVDGEEMEIMLPIIAGYSFTGEEAERELESAGFTVIDARRMRTRPHGTCWQIVARK
jgi:SAM-dependent methyltransferase